MKLKCGDILEFHYDWSDPEKERIGKVLDIRDTYADPVQVKTRTYSRVQRSRYLIRCAMADKTFRQFYTDGLTAHRKVGIIRRTLLRLAGVQFGETSRSKVIEVGEVGQRGN